MASYSAGYGSRATFSPADAPPVDFNFSLLYATDLKGLRVAFIDVYYTTDGDDPAKRLKTGQVGRFEVVHPDDENPADHLVIPLGVLTCISHLVEVRDAVRATYVITQVV
jgi:hypothetical protein